MRIRNFILIILLWQSFALLAQDIPEPMKPFRLVNDFANILSSSESKALESKLLLYNDTTSTQIYVVTISDLQGYPVSDYAFELGEKWGIGQSGKDNGLLILIKPKLGNSRGQAFVATGYGLETYITDAFAGRIVRDYMIPYFVEDDYFGGINAAVDVVIAKLSGEFDADSSSERGIPKWLIILILIIIFVIVTSSSGGDQNISRGGHRRSGGAPIFFPPSSRGGSSSWGGGGFGGGFGGGGGGRFGGGGAGGSW